MVIFTVNVGLFFWEGRAFVECLEYTQNTFFFFSNRSMQLSVTKENLFECANIYKFDLGRLFFNSFTLKVLSLLR